MLAAIARFTPTPEAVEGLYTALEHEAMHQETLLYMWHRIGYDLQHRPVRSMSDGRYPIADARGSKGVAATSAAGPAGDAVLGADRSSVSFGWDNEFDRHVVHVPAFDIDI